MFYKHHSSFHLIQALYVLFENSVTYIPLGCFQPNSCLVTKFLSCEQNVYFLEMKLLLICLIISSFFIPLSFLLLHQVKD